MIRVLLVEDDPSVRKGLERVLARAKAELTLVASCATGQEAIAAAQEKGPVDVALVDLGLPDLPGTEVIRAIRRQHPTTTALALTVFDDPEFVFAALRAGARGYLLKETEPARLLSAIKEAAEGGAPMSPAIARKVVEAFHDSGADAQVNQIKEPLTPREHDILELLVHGLTYAQVADRLGIALGTVQTHIKRIYEKLEVNSKAEAAAVALRRGIVPR